MRALACLGVLCAALGACAGSGSQLQVEYAPDFKPGAHTLSVLGVYRDGRMSDETWSEIGPKFAAALGSSHCPAAYGSELLQKQPELYEAVEDYARSEGVTDGLLGQLAAAAAGDTIVLLTMNGEVTAPSNRHASTPKHGAGPTQAGTSSGWGGGAGRRNRGRHTGRRQNSANTSAVQGESGDALELSALLYSVRQHQSVASIGMRYTGTNLDEALTALSAELQRSVAGSSCLGWDWARAGNATAAQIRKLNDEP